MREHERTADRPRSAAIDARARTAWRRRLRRGVRRGSPLLECPLRRRARRRARVGSRPRGRAPCRARGHDRIRAHGGSLAGRPTRRERRGRGRRTGQWRRCPNRRAGPHRTTPPASRRRDRAGDRRQGPQGRVAPQRRCRGERAGGCDHIGHGVVCRRAPSNRRRQFRRPARRRRPGSHARDGAVRRDRRHGYADRIRSAGPHDGLRALRLRPSGAGGSNRGDARVELARRGAGADRTDPRGVAAGCRWRVVPRGVRPRSRGRSHLQGRVGVLGKHG